MTALLKSTRLAAVAAVTLTGSIAASAKPYTVTPISVPGSFGDQAVAVNASGTVLGMYYDGNNEPHGYVYKAGTVTAFDVPGAAGTDPLAINASGDVVGYYTDQQGVTYGFIYRGGHYFTVGYQGYTSAELTGINDARLTCGDAYNGFNSPFTYKTGRFKLLDKKANGYASAINNNGEVLALIGGQPAIYKDNALTYIPASGGTPTGINDKGVAVGYLTDSNQEVAAFLYSRGAVTTFAVQGARQTFFSAINANGVIAGGYEDTNSNQFVFIKDGGKVTQLPEIGSNYMTPLAINAGGIVAGAYLDEGNQSRSFVATPPQ